MSETFVTVQLEAIQSMLTIHGEIPIGVIRCTTIDVSSGKIVKEETKSVDFHIMHSFYGGRFVMSGHITISMFNEFYDFLKNLVMVFISWCNDKKDRDCVFNVGYQIWKSVKDPVDPFFLMSNEFALSIENYITPSKVFGEEKSPYEICLEIIDDISHKKLLPPIEGKFLIADSINKLKSKYLEPFLACTEYVEYDRPAIVLRIDFEVRQKTKKPHKKKV